MLIFELEPQVGGYPVWRDLSSNATFAMRPHSLWPNLLYRITVVRVKIPNVNSLEQLGEGGKNNPTCSFNREEIELKYNCGPLSKSVTGIKLFFLLYCRGM